VIMEAIYSMIIGIFLGTVIGIRIGVEIMYRRQNTQRAREKDMIKRLNRERRSGYNASPFATEPDPRLRAKEINRYSGNESPYQEPGPMHHIPFKELGLYHGRQPLIAKPVRARARKHDPTAGSEDDAY